mmetsp:Transcript_65482/g.211151  ORF Transcript_65482/g.211151 Transcript_65482/m.211151 type:complete len:209 (-) Transcript_65482:398-1024(-)
MLKARLHVLTSSLSAGKPTCPHRICTSAFHAQAVTTSSSETNAPSGSPALAAPASACRRALGRGTQTATLPISLGISGANSGTICSVPGTDLAFMPAGFSPLGSEPVESEWRIVRSWLGVGSTSSPRKARDQFLKKVISASASTTPCMASMPIAVPPPGNCVTFSLKSGASGLLGSGSMPVLSGTIALCSSVEKKLGAAHAAPIGTCE